MEINIESKDQGERIDKFIEKKLRDLGFDQATRSMIQDNVTNGCRVNNLTVKPSYKLKMGDEVIIFRDYWTTFFKEKDLSVDIIPQEGELNIIFEDDDLLVLIKPKNMIVHPGVGNRDDTIANRIKYYLQAKDEFDSNMDRAGIVHRLDKGVSGIMVIAKNKDTQDKLKKQFSQREVDKLYIAQCQKYKYSPLETLKSRDLEKVLKKIEEEGMDNIGWFEASGYIGRSPKDRYRMEFRLYQFPGSKPAKSLILRVGKEEFLIKIITGRMHQIRATFLYYGYYIIGDSLYNPGKRDNSSNEIMLKSIYLSFKHPKTEEMLSFIHL